MAHFEDIRKNTAVRGSLPNGKVKIVDVIWHGSDVVEALYKGSDGGPGANAEATLEIQAAVGDGVPDHVVGTVTESCRVRKFISQGPVKE